MVGGELALVHLEALSQHVDGRPVLALGVQHEGQVGQVGGDLRMAVVSGACG